MSVIITSEPAAEPVTLVELKAQAQNINWTDDDTLLTSYIKRARRSAEEFTRRKFITQTLQWTADLPRLPYGGLSGPIYGPRYRARSEYDYYEPLEVPYPRLQSVSSLYAESTPGTWTLVPSTAYVVDTAVEPGTLRFVDGIDGNRIKVTYVAGYGAAGTTVPEEIKQAILERAFGLYMMRVGEPVPAEQWKALLGPYRIWNL